ncbi:MAG: hypothetical protein ACRDKX_00415 [Solirubrobacterales bacterium]
MCEPRAPGCRCHEDLVFQIDPETPERGTRRCQNRAPGRDPTVVDAITDSLAEALDRIEDFKAVQHDRGTDELLAAVICLQESVGIRDDARALLGERIEALQGKTKATGHLLLGLIIGLSAADLARETRL